MGYVAPPLDGIWATAPFFHNGSVRRSKDVWTAQTPTHLVSKQQP